MRNKKQLNKYKDELQRMDCPIVIAGEYTFYLYSASINLISHLNHEKYLLREAQKRIYHK